MRKNIVALSYQKPGNILEILCGVEVVRPPPSRHPRYSYMRAALHDLHAQLPRTDLLPMD